MPWKTRSNISEVTDGGKDTQLLSCNGVVWTGVVYKNIIITGVHQ